MELFKQFNENRVLAQSYFNDYMAGDLTIQDLLDLVDVNLIAKKSELQMVLKNKFMITSSAETHNISELDVTKRISELLKHY